MKPTTKYILILLICFLKHSSILSQQTLWGLTEKGGNASIGAIYSINLGNEQLTERYSFPATTPGMVPNGALVEGDDGKLYGTTFAGGSFNGGLLFRVDTAGDNYEILAEFNTSTGTHPAGGLCKASNGKLYGTATHSGQYNNGTIYSFDPAIDSFQIIYQLGPADGSFVNGGLMKASNGKLYGVCLFGGTMGGGTLFSWDLATASFKKEYNFDPLLGKHPSGTLTQASDGNLYGFTGLGGANEFGGIYKFDPLSNQLTVIHHFTNNSIFSLTISPNTSGQPMIELNGLLYGITQSGGQFNRGVLFSIDINQAQYNPLVEFPKQNLEKPSSGLMLRAGKFIGTLSSTNPPIASVGAIYTYDPINDSLEILHSLPTTRADGAFPAGNLLLVGNKIFGTTTNVHDGYGVLYSYNLQTSIYEPKLIFTKPQHGEFPVGKLVEGEQGILYGMTHKGGSADNGTIFSFDLVNHTLSTRYEFTEPEGRDLNGSLKFASDGKAYGMSVFGGANNRGTLFRFDPTKDSLEVVHSFGLEFSGDLRRSQLVEGQNSYLYGFVGGSNASILFSFDIQNDQYLVLHQFEDSTGKQASGIIIGMDGNLYGTTTKGGNSGEGVIFTYNLQDSSYAVLYDFSFADGQEPFGNMVEHTAGKFIGLTQRGNNGDVLFEYDMNQDQYAVLHIFSPDSGSNPTGEVVMAEGDKVYGTALDGPDGFGVLFRYDLSTGNYSTIANFSEALTGIPPTQLKSYLLVRGFATAIEAEIANPISNLTIYPNPASTIVNFSFSLSEPAAGCWTISDMQGKVLLKKTFDRTWGNIQEVWNTDFISPGIYFLKIQTGKHAAGRKIVIYK